MSGDYQDFDDEDNTFNQQLRFGMNGFHAFNRSTGFFETYRCYSAIMMQGNERESVNFGGKIILPQSALAKLASLHIQYPMLFSLHSTTGEVKNRTHAGVLEFTAEEGRVYIPQWMMQTLLLEPGDLIEVNNSSLPLGSFVKIQPQTVDFLDISDPKAVLENALRNFSTLSEGDIIQINYNDHIYEILVMEVRPANNYSSISIVETDLEVDFAPPLGYVEPERVPSRHGPATVLGPTMASKMGIEVDQQPVVDKFVPFGGSGMKLGGLNKGKEPIRPASSSSLTSQSRLLRSETNESGLVAPPLKLPFGKLFFGYPIKPLKSSGTEVEPAKNTFQGTGYSLRKQKGNGSGSATGSRVSTPIPGTSSNVSSAQQSPALGPQKTNAFEGKGYSLK